MYLNFPGTIPESDFVAEGKGRLLGPDLHGAYLVATGSEYVWESVVMSDGVDSLAVKGTRVTVRPVGPSELLASERRVTHDGFGQPWLELVPTVGVS